MERLTYHSAESGYTVARLQRPKAKELTTIVGSFANIQPGQTLHLTGFWRDHPQYGTQFQVTQYKETKPATLTGIEKYLGSGLIKGVGPVTASRIVAHFGLDTLEVIENQIERLVEVKGIAKKRIRMIQQAWETQKAIKEVMVFLQGHGVSTTYAVKIYKQYGERAIATVTENPYQLATDIYGIGFLSADKIARNLGVPADSEFRYSAGLVHSLTEAAEDGHCYLPQPELIKRTYSLLTTDSHTPDEDAIARIITHTSEQQDLVIETHPDTPPLCYKPTFYYTEQNLGQRLAQHLRHQRIEPISDTPHSDCLWHGGGFEPDHGVQVVCELISDLIPNLGFNPASDVQVLCPMTRGVVGTRNFNQVLQQLINPPSPDKVEISRGGITLRVGDRVIQQTNDYQRDVFNGDLGVITAIDTTEQEVKVQYQGRIVTYDYADLNEITLAWAVTIHKSQGSEYPVVILPLYTQHYLMLSRNLLYTGLTRAQKLAIVIGSKKAIAISVNQTLQQQRYTQLRQRIVNSQ